MKFGRKSCKLIGNTVGKGEIARYEQFLLFPQCFQTTSTVDTSKQGLFGRGFIKARGRGITGAGKRFAVSRVFSYRYQKGPEKILLVGLLYSGLTPL